MQQMVFIAKLIVRSTCFGHHYAHQQELKSIIQVVAACGTWCFGLQVVGLVWSCRLCVLMTGIMVPETCWANNKFWNKEPSVASRWPFYFHVAITLMRRKAMFVPSRAASTTVSKTAKELMKLRRVNTTILSFFSLSFGTAAPNGSGPPHSRGL